MSSIQSIDHKRFNAICDECGQWFYDPARPFRKWQITRFCPRCAIDGILRESRQRDVSEVWQRHSEWIKARKEADDAQ